MGRNRLPGTSVSWREAVAPFSGEMGVDKTFMLCGSGKKQITHTPKQKGIPLSGNNQNPTQIGLDH